MIIAMLLAPTGVNLFVPGVQAQTQVAPQSQGFHVDAADLRFIFHQIEVSQDHAAGGTLLGPGVNQVHDAQLPVGLRTVDGSFNNLVPGQTHFGQADLTFPRLLAPNYRTAETLPFDPDGPGPQVAGGATSYASKKGFVSDSQPRLITNLIVDQTPANPAALAAAENPCGAGGFVCQGTATPDPTTGALFIPNITPDFGLSAPFNLMFAFFGQFFDHGLDLVTKGGGTVIIPLKDDDPLVAGPDHIFGNADDIPANQRFMVMARGTNQPGPDGVVGDNPATPQDESADDIQDGQNTTTPWVDQNQTYTSHPSHQVFLRQYVMTLGRPLPDGKVLDGGDCAPRPTGIPGDVICNIGNWNEVKAQAATKLGIQLTDQDIFDVPLILTDPYGHFKPGLNGFPQVVFPGNVLRQGNPAAPISVVGSFKTGHAFLNDIAHSAVPSPGFSPDADTTVGSSLAVMAPNTYDDELLGVHFITGDGRGNENIGLTTMHQIFHAEHNRLASDIDRMINTQLTPAEVTAWHAVHAGSGWGYGERIFQAARFVTEMQYQHLVFEEFARKVQPLINPFLGGLTSIDGAISAEFAHTVYRLGHSMLPEVVTRVNADGSVNDIRLFDAFLNPASYNDGGTAGHLTADKAAGSIVRGLSQTVANELDEFITDSVRNTLVGLPLDLGAINIARGRSEGIPSLNSARAQFYAVNHDAAVRPYANWFEFGLNLKHAESLTNFIAAYGTHATITGATTMTAKRIAANRLVASNSSFMFDPASTSGLDKVDFWVGGLAERQAVFGGLLGSTFNYVFERQLERLQDGDRFYYLQRTDGLNLRFQLEGNSFAELIRRNTDFSGGMDVIFNTADFIFAPGDFPATFTDPAVDLGNGISLLTMPDGTHVFFDILHTGKNIVFNGTEADDSMQADIGDDTLYGNGGNDRLNGFEGNDTIHGGSGDDVIFGGNGDDVLKGGDGNDALSTGPGFGADLVLAGDGNDFMLGGDDGVEYFGNAGNDIIVDGAMRSEGMFAGPGDDWIYDGEGHDGGMFGDNGNVFDLLAGLDPVGGDDVLGGGPGQDNHWGEGGDDIMLMSEGTNKFFGDYGFDWITLRGWTLPEFVELFLSANPAVNLNFNDLRNRYRFVDGASGWDLDDHIAGSNHVLCVPPGEVAECLIPGMELTAVGAAKISGLTALMGPAAFNQPLTGNAIPGIKGEGFMGGDILLGGRGSDILEGRQGDDLIDGDVWLNAQLEATLNPDPVTGQVVVKLVDDPRDLIDDVFSNPQRLNPGHIRIVKSIVTPVVERADCGAAVTFNCDTAVFNFPLAEFDIVLNANNTVTVTHVPPTAAGIPSGEGSDTLRNIEQLRFITIDPVTLQVTDITTIPNPGAGGGSRTVIVPNVVGMTSADAASALTLADFVSSTVLQSSTTVPIDIVISQNPAAGSSRVAGTNVTLRVSTGTVVPNVVGGTQTQANTAIVAAGLTIGAVTSQVNAAPAGRVITQSPIGGTSANPGTAVAVTVSLGPANRTVPDVIGQTQAAASSSITGAGLTVGAITSVNSTTVASGSVITQSPLGGAVVASGSAVGLTVSLGPIFVPNVVGATQASATSSITAAGLIVGTVSVQSSTTVASGNVISSSPVAGTAVERGSTVSLVVSSGSAPTILSTVTRNKSTQDTFVNTLTTIPVPANTLVLAFVSTDGPSVGANTVVTTVNNSGTALTWTNAVRANAQFGDAEVWWAFSTAAHAAMTVNAELTNSVAASMTVVTISGTNAASMTGSARLAANAASGKPSATLTTTRANSLVFAVGVDWDMPRVMTPAAGQTIINQFRPTVGDTYWSQRTNGIPAAGTSVTISDTYGTGSMIDRWNMALIEIRTP